MNKIFPISVIAVIVLLVGGWVWLSPASPTRDNRPTLAVTIFPLADIAERIAGDRWNVVLIIPPGTTEHTRSLAPQTVASLQGAQALFMIGHGLDTVLAGQISGAIGSLPQVVVDKGIELREFEIDHAHQEEEGEEHEEGDLDPHYWLSIPNGQQIARNITAHMVEIDPDHTEEYEQNLNAYIAELDMLEEQLQAIAAQAPQMHFISAHDAWGYLASQYGFELVGTFEPTEGREPSPADIQHLEELITEYSIAAFYTEPQKQSSSATRLFGDGLGLDIKVLDPVGGLAGRESYIDLMRYNVSTLAAN
ncbi:MAG: metal ABC transporter substrate-binding protein [Candidatus Andersenbacteria bacterium]